MKGMHIGRGWRSLLKDESWHVIDSGSLVSNLKDIFKGTNDISMTKYCPHLDRIIKIQTNPPMTECDHCIEDMKKQ